MTLFIVSLIDEPASGLLASTLFCSDIVPDFVGVVAVGVVAAVGVAVVEAMGEALVGMASEAEYDLSRGSTRVDARSFLMRKRRTSCSGMQ